ncbi:MAG: hypothetical protein ACIAS6_01880 [Phycisphaerales bacterium JB060]
MSVRFDQSGSTTQSLEAVYPPPNATGGLRLTGVRISITLWMNLESDDVPGVGERATVWWFGEAGQPGNHLVLEAVPGTTSGFNLQASLVGQTTLGAGAARCGRVATRAARMEGRWAGAMRGSP